MLYKYFIKSQAVMKIRAFYRNVHMKYRNLYSYNDRLRYINNTIDAIFFHRKSYQPFFIVT
jgi:hypothetical protein